MTLPSTTEIPPFKPATLRVWLWLESKTRAGGQRFTHAEIADGAGVSKRSVVRAVEDLRVKRRISTRRADNGATVYRLIEVPT